MNIVGVILNNTTNSTCVSPNVYPYDKFLEESANYSRVSIALQLDTESFIFVDIRKLLTEQPMIYYDDGVEVMVSDWTTLETYIKNLDETLLQNYLTISLVPRLMLIREGYWIPCPFYSNIETQLRIVGVENTAGIHVEMGNINDPYTRTRGIESVNAQDLVIVNTGRTDIDLSNSIPIINGSAFLPEVWTNKETGNNELFALQAGKWIRHSNWNNNKVKTVKHERIPNGSKHDTLTDRYRGGENPVMPAHCYNKGIMLVDFSSIGTIDVYKLSDCREGTITGTDTQVSDADGVASVTVNPHKAWLKGKRSEYKVSYYTIKFALPEGATPGIPILCIGGRLFFTTDNKRLHIQQDGEYIWVTIQLERHVFDNIILSNNQWFGKQTHGTTQLEVDPNATIDELLKDTPYNNGTPEDIYRYLNEDLSTPFIIILHAHKRVVATRTKPIMKLGPDKLLFPPDVGGLLYNNKTHEIIDYVRIPYMSGTLVEFTLQRPLRAIHDCDPSRLTKPQIGFEWNDFVNREKYVKFNMYDELRDLDNFELIDFAYMEV